LQKLFISIEKKTWWSGILFVSFLIPIEKTWWSGILFVYLSHK